MDSGVKLCVDMAEGRWKSVRGAVGGGRRNVRAQVIEHVRIPASSARQGKRLLVWGVYVSIVNVVDGVSGECRVRGCEIWGCAGWSRRCVPFECAHLSNARTFRTRAMCPGRRRSESKSAAYDGVWRLVGGELRVWVCERRQEATGSRWRHGLGGRG